MKKVILMSCLLFCLIAGPVNAYIVEVGFDETIDFTLVHGFSFDLSINTAELTLEKQYAPNGGLPQKFSDTFPWDVWVSSTSITGYDYSFGNFPLTPGVVVKLTGPREFSVNNFVLSNNEDPNGSYPLAFTVNQKELEGASGINYTFSAVPIPSSMLLLGGGLLAFFGIRRRQ